MSVQSQVYHAPQAAEAQDPARWSIIDQLNRFVDVHMGDMTLAETRVVLKLLRHCDREGVSFPSISEIARVAKLSGGTVKNALSALRRSGWITSEPAPGGRGCTSVRRKLDIPAIPRHSINGHSRDDCLFGETVTGGAKTVTPPVNKRSSVTSAHKENRPENSSLGTDQPPQPPEGAAGSAAKRPAPQGAETPPGFDRFWSEWPRHPRKLDRSRCARRWKRLGLEPIAEQVITALRHWKVSRDWTKQNGEFIPMPMSWLNKAPWEADPPDPSMRGNGHANGNGRHNGDDCALPTGRRCHDASLSPSGERKPVIPE